MNYYGNWLEPYNVFRFWFLRILDWMLHIIVGGVQMQKKIMKVDNSFQINDKRLHLFLQNGFPAI